MPSFESRPLRLNDGPLWSLDGVEPRLAADAWVAPTACVIGRVEIGAGSSIWFNCVLRGDTNIIRIGAGSNVQDGSVIHVNEDPEESCVIGDHVLIGHMAIIHAAQLHDRAFVGMGAVVLDRAVIESGGVLAAGALLPPGRRVGAGELWAGAPARFVRRLSEEEQAGFATGAPGYAANAARFRAGLRAV